MRNAQCVKSLQRFLRDERENTFRCKIVICGESEIVNMEIRKSKMLRGENSQVTVPAFLLLENYLEQIRNEKLRRLNGLFSNIVKTGRKHYTLV